MCVIVYKPSNVTIDLEDLEKMWRHNSDGAGMAFFVRNENETLVIHLEKGFMKLSDLKTRIAELQNNYTDFSMAIHLRTATSGGVSSTMTHPFIVDANPEYAQAKTGDYPCVLMHNGVLTSWGSTLMSDTLDFTINMLSHVDPSVRVRFLNMLYSSKFLLMQDSQYYFCGYGWEEYKGLKVSNLNWNWEYKTCPQIQPNCTAYVPQYASKKGSVYYYKKWEEEDKKDLEAQRQAAKIRAKAARKKAKISSVIELPMSQKIADANLIITGVVEKAVDEVSKTIPIVENETVKELPKDEVITDPVAVSAEINAHGNDYGLD